jgi:hypothetical protein
MSDYRHRLVKAGGASSQTFSYEDGKGYRGYHFDTEAVKDHVKYKQDQAQYFKKDWRYVGSIPMEMLIKYQITLPEDEQADFFHRFATDKLTKQKFIRWLQQNHPGLLPGEKR